MKDQESVVLEKLIETWNEFLKLSIQHPDDQDEFRISIHRCQHMIMARHARKMRPDLYYNEQEDNEKK